MRDVLLHRCTASAVSGVLYKKGQEGRGGCLRTPSSPRVEKSDLVMRALMSERGSAIAATAAAATGAGAAVGGNQSWASWWCLVAVCASLRNAPPNRTSLRSKGPQGAGVSLSNVSSGLRLGTRNLQVPFVSASMYTIELRVSQLTPPKQFIRAKP
jgi:hypothetical protein